MQWTGCTKDSSWQLYECHQLYSAGQVLHYGCDGYGWLYPRVSSGALSQAVPYHSYPSTQKFHSKSPFLPFSSLSCFSFKEISAQMGYLELRWSKHWLCLMSKSLNETPAELLRTTLMLAPQALRVTSWELPQHCLALKKSVYFTYLWLKVSISDTEVCFWALVQTGSGHVSLCCLIWGRCLALCVADRGTGFSQGICSAPTSFQV